jgi:hypothetical protein
MAFSCLSCSVSLSICKISLSSCFILSSCCILRCSKCSIRRSTSGSRRQFSIDNNCRQRGRDENDSPLLLELEAAAKEGDVVIGGKEGDQAEGDASEHLKHAQAIKAQPAAGRCC